MIYTYEYIQPPFLHWLNCYPYIYIYHHHDLLLARIFQNLSRHPPLASIASGRSSRVHPRAVIDKL